MVPRHSNVHHDMHAISMFYQHRVSNLLLAVERLDPVKNFARIPCRICPANLPINQPINGITVRISAQLNRRLRTQVSNTSTYTSIYSLCLSVCLSVCFTCVLLCVASCMFRAFHVLLLWAKLPELHVMMMMMIANCGTLCRF